MDEHLTNGAQPGDAGTSSSGGAQAGSEGSNPSEDGSSLTLTEINQLLGKQYKDKTSALKSLKDMSSMAGKAADLGGRKEESTGALEERMKALELDAYFARNPDHEANREILEALALKNNTTIQKAADLEVYKELSKRASKPEKRTVVESKNRQQTTSDRDKAFEQARSTGDWGSFIVEHHMKE